MRYEIDANIHLTIHHLHLILQSPSIVFPRALEIIVHLLHVAHETGKVRPFHSVCPVLFNQSTLYTLQKNQTRHRHSNKPDTYLPNSLLSSKIGAFIAKQLYLTLRLGQVFGRVVASDIGPHELIV
jgi:hypothetical protein